MTETDLIYALALQNVSKIGDITAKKLINYCGSAEAVLKEKPSKLLKIDGIGRIMISDLNSKHHLLAAEKELKFIEKEQIECHYFTEDSYPKRLKHCVDGPILLFQSGNIIIKNQPIISIVGARKITTQGIAICERLIEALAIYNPIIVSGFAYGTDITAQKAALKHNLQTIGCDAHFVLFLKKREYSHQVRFYIGLS